MKIRKTLVVDVGGKNYTITALKATLGLKYFKKLSTAGLDSLDENEIKELICESTGLSSDKFELEFSGDMLGLLKLTGEIINLNFEDVFQGLDSEESENLPE